MTSLGNISIPGETSKPTTGACSSLVSNSWRSRGNSQTGHYGVQKKAPLLGINGSKGEGREFYLCSMNQMSARHLCVCVDKIMTFGLLKLSMNIRMTC